MMTSILFNKQLFEDMANQGIDKKAKHAVRDKIHNITGDSVWEVFLTGTEEKDYFVHVELNFEDKVFRSIVYFKLSLYDRLFGHLVQDQHTRELVKLVTTFTDKMDSIDWAQFVLDLDNKK